MQTTPKKQADMGPLHELLLRACPPDKDGKKSIPRLAKLMGVSHQLIYDRWIKNNRIPTVHKRPSKLLKIADGRVTREELLPYLDL